MGALSGGNKHGSGKCLTLFWTPVFLYLKPIPIFETFDMYQDAGFQPLWRPWATDVLPAKIRISVPMCNHCHTGLCIYLFAITAV